MVKNFIYMLLEYVICYKHLIGQFSSHLTHLFSGNSYFGIKV